jgi:hypothetical protein
MNLTRGQWFSIAIVVVGVLGASTAQLNDLFGPAATKAIVSASTLLTSLLAGINALLGGQGSQIAAVQAMPGVEKIMVNEKASPTLATMAVANENPKIEATPQALQAVADTAKAAL